MRTRLPALLFVPALVGAALGGCATPPKPPELEGYENLRRTAPISELSKRSPDLIAASDRFGNKAREEWEGSDLEESRRDALIAQIKLKTAIALLQQEQAKARIQTMSSEESSAQEEYNSLAKDLASLTESVNLLQRLGEARRSADADKQRLSQQMTTEQQQAQAEQQRLTLQLATEQKLAAAQLAIRTADTVDAGKYAKPEYQAAVDMFNKAQAEVKQGNLAGAQASAEVAKINADKAAAMAKPSYEQAEQTSKSKQRDEELEREASAVPGAQVRRERRGDLQRLVVMVPDLFAKKNTSLSPGKGTVLDPIAALINKYPSYPVQITGHTDNRGKSGELLALSNTRAQAVFSELVSRGVDAKRLLISGMGGDDPMFDNKTTAGRTKNNRIEVIFLFH